MRTYNTYIIRIFSALSRGKIKKYVLEIRKNMCYDIGEVRNMKFDFDYSMATASDAEIGARICALRKKKHYSQSYLANLIGKSLRTVQKYESGEIKVSVDVVNQLALYLDTTPQFILGYNNLTRPFNTLADITRFLFELEQVANLEFSIRVERPPYSNNWTCAIMIDGKDREAELNANFCLFLESWQQQRQRNKAFHNDPAAYRKWKEEVLANQQEVPVLFIDGEELDESVRRIKNSEIYNPSGITDNE